jgi:VanZ family protein
MAYRKMKRHLFTWGPVFILMALIFLASAQPKMGRPAGPTTSVYFSGAMPIFAGGWETLIKKGAHVLSYGLLAVLLLRALRLSGKPSHDALAMALLITLSFAITDELHQSFVAGRSSSVRDIGLDYLGATTATLLALQIAACRKYVARRKLMAHRMATR